MYSLNFYGQMIADTLRMEAYATALRRAVNANSVVLDLGCGPGVFALLACKFGARRVYAVEPESVVGLARELAAANDCADRIEFFESLSTETSLPEPANIIIFDLRGVLPWFEQNIPSMIDARKRLLARDGLLIPGHDLLWATVVEAPGQHHELVGPWQDNQFGLDLSAASRMITNTWRKTQITQDQFLAEPVQWTEVDYYNVDNPDMHAEISWRAARNGTAHGIAVWFDSELAIDVQISNHPAAPRMIYGVGLFPLSEPVELVEGDRIELQLAADLVQDGYVWRWDTKVFSGCDEAHPKASFAQSTFYGVPLSAAQLRKSAP